MREPMDCDTFPSDATGLPAARRPELASLADGDALELTIGPVACTAAAGSWCLPGTR
jgi:hypothetical protein